MAYKRKRKTLASVSRGPRRPIFPYIALLLVLLIAVGFAVGYILDKGKTDSNGDTITFDPEQPEEVLNPEATNPRGSASAPASDVSSPYASAVSSPLPSSENSDKPEPTQDELAGYFTIELLPFDTDLETLPPKLADKYLPDYTELEIEEPVYFSADRLEGTRVIAQNDRDYAEIYFAETPGGIITVMLGGGKTSGVYSQYELARPYLEKLHVLER
ncbi:MAG: hypothetical protein LBN97_01615 [Oscillospiraceae bacterium]|jgi:hypothetical protein|nr:hypothetical protein [Oscillospiraceae bacterium]